MFDERKNLFGMNIERRQTQIQETKIADDDDLIEGRAFGIDAVGDKAEPVSSQYRQERGDACVCPVLKHIFGDQKIGRR